MQERKEARKKTRALKLRSEPLTAGVRVRGKWFATRKSHGKAPTADSNCLEATRRQDDVGVGSALSVFFSPRMLSLTFVRIVMDPVALIQKIFSVYIIIFSRDLSR